MLYPRAIIQNKRLKAEWIAEFDYQPTKCSRSYRVIALRKEIEVTSGQQKLFDDEPYFFDITNASKTSKSTRQVVSDANKRCNQEDLISQLKAYGALTAPLDTLLSNGAYMAIAALAWSLKIWSGLLIQPSGPPQQQEEEQTTKRETTRMVRITFCLAGKRCEKS